MVSCFPLKLPLLFVTTLVALDQQVVGYPFYRSNAPGSLTGAAGLSGMTDAAAERRR